jgi:hypothetical protein
MKHTSLVLVTIASFFVFVGCARPQPAPSPTPVIGWGWTLATAPPGAPALSTWTTTLYVATVASATTPAPTPGGSAYKAVPNGTVAGNIGSFSDTTETPGTFIYALTQESFTISGVTYYGPYSAVSAVFAVPALPTAPGSPVSTVTTAMLAPPLKGESPHTPTMAANIPRSGAPTLTVRN